MLCYSDWRHFDDKLDKILENQGTILSNLQTLISKGTSMDATLQQVLDDLDVIKQEAGDYIAKRDAIDVQLNATIADLQAKLAANAITIADFQSGVASALSKAEEDKAILAPPKAVPVPPAASYPSAADLTAAVTAYQAAGGADGFTLDGNVVGNAGTSGTVNAYFTHSADGHVDTTGPTN